jgi:hypothetical protein
VVDVASGKAVKPWAVQDQGRRGLVGAAAVGGPSAMQHAHGAIALALGRKRYSAGGPTGLGYSSGPGTVPRPQYSFPILLLLPDLKNTKSCTSYSPKFSKLYQVVVNFKRDNFTFGNRFIFPTEFELKI